MKYILCLIFSVATAAFATDVGDTFQQVITERGNPVSQIDAGSLRVLKYSDIVVKLKDNVVVSTAPIVAESKPSTPLPAPSPAAKRDVQIAAVKKEQKNAVMRVSAIINQPVAPVEETPRMKVVYYNTGWFHEGAIKPDFNNVDVRKTQEFVYDRHQYVSSKLKPGLVFVGNELEFNSMTKYFYEDRSLPKKKLSENEMLAINQLYRIIGRCEKQLLELQAP